MKLLTKNRTLGVRTFNLPARFTCPGSSLWCEHNCYACKGKFTIPSVAYAQQARLERTLDLAAFVDDMVAECSGLARVRVHSSGDFYSLDYLRAWQDIAAMCPDTVFFGYTRCWVIDQAWRDELARSPSNLIILWSCDPTMPDPREYGATAISWIASDPKAPRPNCPKQLTHGRSNCSTCGVCTLERSVSLNRH